MQVAHRAQRVGAGMDRAQVLLERDRAHHRGHQHVAARLQVGRLGHRAHQRPRGDARAFQRDADVVVMLHPDGQYEPELIPKLVEPVLRGPGWRDVWDRLLSGMGIEGLPAGARDLIESCVPRQDQLLGYWDEILRHPNAVVDKVSRDELAAVVPGWDRFWAVADRVDPDRRFRGPYLSVWRP